MRGLIGVAALAWIGLLTSAVEAQPLDERRSDAFYGIHGGITAAGFAAGGLTLALAKGLGPNLDLRQNWLDNGVRANFSESASQLSDQLLWFTITIPLAAQMSNGFDTALANAGLIYAQAHSANFLLLSVSKSLVRRPRPYTHATEPRIQEFADHEGTEAYRSFYSGHTSTAFTSAMAGSILYAARTTEPWSRHFMWALQFSLAGITGNLRVTAGRHYRTDVLVGALVGSGIGLAIPALHRVGLERVEWTEWVVGGGSAATMVVLSEVIGICDLLGAPPPCPKLKRDVKIPTTRESDRHADPVGWTVLPAAFEGGAGVQAVGFM